MKRLGFYFLLLGVGASFSYALDKKTALETAKNALQQLVPAQNVTALLKKVEERIKQDAIASDALAYIIDDVVAQYTIDQSARKPEQNKNTQQASKEVVKQNDAIDLAKAQLLSLGITEDVTDLLNEIGRLITKESLELKELQDIIDFVVRKYQKDKKESSAPKGNKDQKHDKEADAKNKETKKTKILAFLRPGAQDVLPVPRALQGKVYYLNTAQQGENECGSYAIYNTVALDVILKKERLYEAKAPIKALFAIEVDKLKKQLPLKQCQLDGDEILSELDKRDVSKPIYIVKDTQGKLSPAGTGLKSPDIADTFAALKKGPFEYAFFICNTGAHWTLATIIRAPNEEPYIIYMDSNNEKLELNSDTYKILNALCQKVGI